MNLAGTVHINKLGCCLLVALILIICFYTFSGKETPNISKRKVLNEVNLRKLLRIAIIAAEEGGNEIINLKNNVEIKTKGKTKEGANDFVTTADFKSHCTIVHRLEQNFPTINIISEEKKISCDSSLLNNSIVSDVIGNKLNDEWVKEDSVKIWIDPLDATQEYTEKLYQYVSVMICVVAQGKPIIGVIHKPFMKETTWAWVGKGHSIKLDKIQIPANLKKTKDIRTFIISRSHAGVVKKIIKTAFTGEIEIVEAGGAGYKILEVVNNRADIYLHTTEIKKWDICAGNVILNALGGKMSTKFNEQIDYADSDNPKNENGLIATMRDHKFYLDLL